ncbi:hypothetical protein FACS1894172_12560 [Spirochaetia bacterium]|nr:hypothetical protein FACS1894164_11180 [Spirochaetia bacterium]GHU33643.1 hypothetical protein FACS1894172_12560 [Spirochaetia bacterium]
MVGVYLFVEGGGNSNDLKTECRHGFSTFLEKAGLKGKMPRIVACGGREQAFDRFITATKNGETAILLIDSESAIASDCQQGDSGAWKPWKHLKNRPGDNWEQPDNTSDNDCHLMVQCMESWFIADRETLKTFFGKGFNGSALPSTQSSVELIDKAQVYKSFAEATKNCETKKPYGKGEHSFKILALIDPVKVITASPWADRFVKTAKAKMGIAR